LNEYYKFFKDAIAYRYVKYTKKDGIEMILDTVSNGKGQEFDRNVKVDVT